MSSKTDTSVNVLVIGGGPAGMIAAGRAAECGRSVLLLEKNNVLGKKLNLTGGGRCNITNAEYDNRTLLGYFNEAAPFLFSPFSRFSAEDTFRFFEERGLPLVVEDRQRAFPATFSAPDVTRVLTDYMQEHGVEVRLQTEVRKILTEGNRIVGVESDMGVIRCESLILATGGAAYRQTGSTGIGFDWLKSLGHSVQQPNPEVVPLKVKEDWVKALSGTALNDVKIRFQAADGTTETRAGRILFTHFGLSGPMILNSAHAVKKLLKQGDVHAEIDLQPKLEIHELDQLILQVFNEHPKRTLRNAIKPLVPPGLSRTVIRMLDASLTEQQVSKITQSDRRQLAHLLKGLPLTVTATMGYNWAVICDGGLDLTEVDTRRMCSRRYPNLFIVGDLLNISRPSGGFSLQLCWTTGYVAGEEA